MFPHPPGRRLRALGLRAHVGAGQRSLASNLPKVNPSAGWFQNDASTSMTKR